MTGPTGIRAVAAASVALGALVAACAAAPTVPPVSPSADASARAAATPAATVPTATAAPTVAPATPVVVATPDPGAHLQALLDAARADSGAPGALALVRLDDRQWTAASGTADAAGTPIDPSATRFRIASITKPLVAALVLDAAASGHLSLGDVVTDVLPGVMRPDPPVTVRQLLSHTSGVFDELNDGDPLADIALIADPALRAQAEEVARRSLAGESVIAPDRVIVALSETHDRYFAPGEGYHYSNTGYQLAGMILEKTTATSLSDLLRTRIAEPLGLTTMTIAPPDLASPELRGYGTSASDGTIVDVTDDLLAFGNGGNGGVISTAGDLLTALQAVVAGRLLSPTATTEMLMPVRQGYGLGIARYTLSCGTFFGHEGGVNGTASIALVSEDGSGGVVVALNLRSGEDPHLPALADRMICGDR